MGACECNIPLQPRGWEVGYPVSDADQSPNKVQNAVM